MEPFSPTRLLITCLVNQSMNTCATHPSNSYRLNHFSCHHYLEDTAAPQSTYLTCSLHITLSLQSLPLTLDPETFSEFQLFYTCLSLRTTDRLDYSSPSISIFASHLPSLDIQPPTTLRPVSFLYTVPVPHALYQHPPPASSTFYSCILTTSLEQ